MAKKNQIEKKKSHGPKKVYSLKKVPQISLVRDSKDESIIKAPKYVISP